MPKKKKIGVTIELLPDASGAWFWRARSHYGKRQIVAWGKEGGYFQVQNARRGANSFITAVGGDPSAVEFLVPKKVVLAKEPQAV